MAKSVYYCEGPYKTPEGYRDFPFIYLMDGSSLTDGQNYLNVALPMQGDADFIVRRMMGMSSVCTQIQPKNATSSYWMSSPLTVIGSAGGPGSVPLLPNYTVVPEKQYPAAGAIWFDLYNVQRMVYAASGGGYPAIYASYLGFQGVKRFKQAANYFQPATPYAYWEKPYTYQLNLTVDWYHWLNTAGVITDPKSFYVPIDNYDFELQTIGFVETTTSNDPTWVGSAITPPANQIGGGTPFLVQLYNSLSQQTSNAPVPPLFIQTAGTGAVSTQAPSPAWAFQSVFPVPGLVYPINSQVRIDITSNIQNTDANFPRTFIVYLQGIQRIPC